MEWYCLQIFIFTVINQTALHVGKLEKFTNPLKVKQDSIFLSHEDLWVKICQNIEKEQCIRCCRNISREQRVSQLENCLYAGTRQHGRCRESKSEHGGSVLLGAVRIQCVIQFSYYDRCEASFKASYTPFFCYVFDRFIIHANPNLFTSTLLSSLPPHISQISDTRWQSLWHR